MTSTPDPWQTEVREQARVAVRIAATRQRASTNVLGYYLRSALAHGLTLDEVCVAGNLSPASVRQLTDPGSVAA